MTHLLGKTVEDRITGYRGIVTGFVTYISGCNQALVQPPIAKDGAPRESLWFDEQRLTVDGTREQIVLDNRKSPGFDKQAPRR